MPPKRRNSEPFAKLIRNARRGKGLTQQALADRIGTARTTIIRWESGRATSVDQKLIQAVCRELDIDSHEAATTLGYLTANADTETGDETSPLDPTLQQVIDALRDPAVSDDDKQRWIDYLMYLRARAREQPASERKAG